MSIIQTRFIIFYETPFCGLIIYYTTAGDSSSPRDRINLAVLLDIRPLRVPSLFKPFQGPCWPAELCVIVQLIIVPTRRVAISKGQARVTGVQP